MVRITLPLDHSRSYSKSNTGTSFLYRFVFFGDKDFLGVDVLDFFGVAGDEGVRVEDDFDCRVLLFLLLLDFRYLLNF